MMAFRTPPFTRKPEFAVWQERAKAARKDLLDAVNDGKVPAKCFNEKVWQDFKNLFLVPMGRCAYCEGRYNAGEFGDAEHFRPKGKITEGRTEVEHPGYYWLAYEWQNLLLSCKKCNSPHPDLDGPKRKASHPGKLNEFPVSAPRVTTPDHECEKWWDQLFLEEPLLLHPYVDDPAEHFEAAKEGWLSPKTTKAKHTIEVCHLNRKELRAERIKAEENIDARLLRIIVKLTLDQDPADDFFDEAAAFSTHLNSKLRQKIQHSAEKLKKLTELRRKRT